MMAPERVKYKYKNNPIHLESFSFSSSLPLSCRELRHNRPVSLAEHTPHTKKHHTHTHHTQRVAISLDLSHLIFSNSQTRPRVSFRKSPSEPALFTVPSKATASGATKKRRTSARIPLLTYAVVKIQQKV